MCRSYAQSGARGGASFNSGSDDLQMALFCAPGAHVLKHTALRFSNSTIFGSARHNQNFVALSDRNGLANGKAKLAVVGDAQFQLTIAVDASMRGFWRMRVRCRDDDHASPS